MSKITPFNAKWDAVSALTCALEETKPDEQVFVIVRKKDMTRCKYAANITNMEVHWECSRLAAEVVMGKGPE
tara:strand:+ start:2493 stop:2708 length:216 start_codon:yes stop_codon:yes gene_type:complete